MVQNKRHMKFISCLLKWSNFIFKMKLRGDVPNNVDRGVGVEGGRFSISVRLGWESDMKVKARTY